MEEGIHGKAGRLKVGFAFIGAIAILAGVGIFGEMQGNMHGMSVGCKNLENLDLSDFNTATVTNMISVFYECASTANIKFLIQTRPHK